MAGLATILGSGAVGPGAGAVVAAAERHGTALRRHGGEGEDYVLPHRIDHAANLRRLVEAGCDRVLAICSVGSLDAALGVGSFVCPDDFIALGGSAPSVYGEARAHSAPGFDEAWRGRVVAAWGECAGADSAGVGAGGAVPPLRDGGVYWQTDGPRFETPAEIRLIAAHADVVGMTMAGECVVARELGLAYAAICVVDNLANGIGAAPLSVEEIERDRLANATALATALSAVLPALA